METENIDASVLANINGENLQNLIESTPYAAASETQINPGVNLATAGEPAIPGYPTGADVSNVGVTPQQPQQPTGGINPAEVERLRAIAFENAQARVDAEERAFQAEIAHLPEYEREVRVLERELEQTRAVNGWLNDTRSREHQAVQQARDESAKRQWGFLIAAQNGLPYNDPAIKDVLLSSNSPQEMRQKAANLAALIGQNRSASAINNVNRGVFAVGGNTGSATAPAGPKPRSGDIEGLIGSRGYQQVNW